MTVMDQPVALTGYGSSCAKPMVRAASALLTAVLLVLPTILWVEPSRAAKLLIAGAGLWIAGVVIKGAAYFSIERLLGRSYADWQGMTGYLAHCLLSLNEILPYLAFIWLTVDTTKSFLVEATIVAYGAAAFEIMLLISLPARLQINDVDLVDNQDRPVSRPRALTLSAIERFLATIIHVTARLGVAAGLLIGPSWVAALCAGCFAVIEAEAIRLVRGGRCRLTRVIKFYCLVSLLAVVSIVIIALMIPGANQ